MPILCRRSSISSASDIFRRSRPSKRISPAVGSISRDRQRTSVDLPDPDRPMMTKISPFATVTSACRTAGTMPASRSASGEGVPPWRARKLSACGP